MSYKKTVGVWALMMVVILLAVLHSPKVHAYAERPTITLSDQDQATEQPVMFDALYLLPNGVDKVQLQQAADRMQKEAMVKEEAESDVVTLVFIVLAAFSGCAWLLFIIVNPWRFPDPPKAPRCPNGPHDVNKCAMPSTSSLRGH